MKTLREPGTGPGPLLQTLVKPSGSSVWTSGLVLSAQAPRLVGEVLYSVAVYYFQPK